ncbi:MAG: hypothetical protein WBA76_05945 [Phormidesmis sp.]
MSSAASRPPKYSGQHSGQSLGRSGGPPGGQLGNQAGDGLRQPPSRPQLMGPPARPKPSAPAPEPASKTPAAKTAALAPEVPQKIGPISPPSERMQYRAIGLLKGKYIASEEQLNRGNIAAEDGTLIDAVLLGRVTSLIKKHIDLERDHLWVVYPRTLYDEENAPALHVQIVGVWEPETLNAKNNDSATEKGSSEKESKYLSTAEATEQCDAFSVRGEVAKYSDDKSEIVINIVQKSKSETVKPKRPFKLLISGQLTGRTTGYFWDLQVERQAGKLVLKKATQIAVVPPKKKSKDDRKEGFNRRRPPAGKPRGNSAPVPKPVPKPKEAAEKVAAEKDAHPAIAQPKTAEPLNMTSAAKTAEVTAETLNPEIAKPGAAQTGA